MLFLTATTREFANHRAGSQLKMTEKMIWEIFQPWFSPNAIFLSQIINVFKKISECQTKAGNLEYLNV